MVGPFPLAESTAWNNTDTGLFQEPQAVEHIRWHPPGLEEKVRGTTHHHHHLSDYYTAFLRCPS